jgi:hypothetical protein
MTRSRSSFAAYVPLACLLTLAPACKPQEDPVANPDEEGPPAGCAAPTAGPTRHSGDVQDGEVWTADGSPHIVEGDVNVRDGATLTIEPCASVLVAAGKRIQVAYPLTPNSGTLIAEGTASQPISFAGEDGARWGSVYVVAPGTARFAYATFEDGGGDDFERGATLVSVGDDESPPDPVFFVDHVTVKKSRGTGLWLKRRSLFVPGSKELTVTESGDDEAPYPLEISDQAIDSLPTGRYTGNRKDEILVRTEGDGTAGSGLTADATLHARGVPYHMGDGESDSFTIGGGADGKVVTLTIEPGVVMKFEPKTAFQIQHFTTEEPATAVVRALGTAEEPIVFTSASPTPSAGDWRGLWFGGIPRAENVFDHVRIEYAGYDCGCSRVTCSGNVETFEAAVIFSMQPPSAFITNSVFKEIAGHGITQGFDGTLVNFRPTNTFEGVSGCIQTMPRLPTTQCPDPLPLCDGM